MIFDFAKNSVCGQLMNVEYLNINKKVSIKAKCTKYAIHFINAT